jgi:hypothetical protein
MNKRASGNAPPFEEPNLNHQNNNNLAGAPPAYDVATTNDYAFLSATSMLQGSTEWHTQTYASWALMLLLAIYGFSTVEAGGDQYERLLMYVLVVLSCYSAANLSAMVRDRSEADLMERFGRGSHLYNASAISTLRGNTPKYYLHWLVSAHRS